MKKILFIMSLLVTYIASSQVRMTGTATSTSNGSAFIDASSNNTNNGTVGTGKGLVFPRVDLSTFTFVGATPTLPSNFPTRFDGMIVYNTKTGGAAGVGTTSGTLAPGFWFYENKSTSVTGGTWKVLGGSASKFTDGTTTAADAVFTGGNVGIGTTSPNASSALDISSTTGGVLISRMTTTQRDAISSPANALLIFNTTNNTFEVFKTKCSCWVTVYDGGTSAASSLINTVPTAKSINYTGKVLVGQNVGVTYTYFDGQSDPEGLTTIKWQIAPANSETDVVDIVGATTASYTPVTSDVSKYIRAVISPRASTGVLNGVFTYGGWKLVESATTPTANNLVVTGTPAQGSTLTGSYTFAGGSGTENLNATTGTKYLWESAATADGQNSSTASLYGASSFTKTYVPQADQLGRYMRLNVKATDSNALSAQVYVASPWVGPVTLATEAAPVATNTSYTPAPAVFILLTGTYSYSDVNNDPEGTTSFQWYRADDASGLNQVAISGATAKTYTVVPADGGKFIGFSVTPKALSGTLTGTPTVVLYNAAATLPVANFTFTGSAFVQNPMFHANRVMNVDNAIKVEINATTAGGIIFSSVAQNGYSFSANTTVATGIQWITLTATGTQTAYNSIGDSFTITGTGFTTETKSILVAHTKLGADFASHYNGWVSGTNATPTAASYTVGETFNNNSSCTAKPISTSACAGSVTGASGAVYPVVSINGQCWMQNDLKEAPSNYTYSNSWFNTDILSDLGLFGFQNTATPNGTAGWGATPHVTNGGFLYQFSAAMNGSTTERTKGACPQGWHVPSDCEWMYLEHGLGMTIAHQTSGLVQRISGQISLKLRSSSSGTNITGFTMVMNGGARYSWNGTFNTTQSFYHSSTSAGQKSTVRQFQTDTNAYWRFDNDWYTGSGSLLRCLKD